MPMSAGGFGGITGFARPKGDVTAVVAERGDVIGATSFAGTPGFVGIFTSLASGRMGDAFLALKGCGVISDVMTSMRFGDGAACQDRGRS